MGGSTPVDRPLLYPIVYTRLEAALEYYVPARIKNRNFQNIARIWKNDCPFSAGSNRSESTYRVICG